MCENQSDNVIVTQVLTSDNFYDLGEMLYDYICELWKYDEENIKLRDKNELISEYFYNADTLFYVISCNNVNIGFAFVGYGSNCNTGIERYIEEFYIKPKYRLHGYGEYLAREILKDVNSVCFDVLKRNYRAKNFWKKIFDLSEWEDISKVIVDDRPPCEWTIWNCYKKRQ